MNEADEASVPLPAPSALYQGLHATWPPATSARLGPFTLRRGGGGGRRVSSATLDESRFMPADVTEAEARMRAWGQQPSFMIKMPEDLSLAARQHDLAEYLRTRGYGEVDRTLLLAAPIADLYHGHAFFGETLFVRTAPLALQGEIWAEGGVGPARMAVMARVQGPKAWLLSRQGQSEGGVGFVAVSGNIAFLHALFVPERHRGQGHARKILSAAARFASIEGAQHLAAVTTGENLPAQKLFLNAGMTYCGEYTYLVKE